MAIDDLSAQILDARRDAIERMFSTRPGQEVVKLDNAYRALTGQEPPDLFGREIPVAEEPKVKKRGPRPDSMLGTVQRFLQSQPILWSYDDLATAMEADGMDSRDENGRPKSGIRVAAFNLVKSGVARRGPNATVYAAGFADEIEQKGLIPEADLLKFAPPLREVG
jgi:hypothetical protein